MNRSYFIIALVLSGILASGAGKPSPTQRIFEQKCSTCHSLERAYLAGKTRISWAKTIAWMQRKPNSRISNENAEVILAHVLAIKPDYPKQLFEHRCAKCHSLESTLTKQLSRQDWHTLVYRERAKAVSWISLDEAEEIIDYLHKVYPANK